MRNLVFLLFIGLVVFAVAGWFLDWYSINRVPTDRGHHSVQIDINSDKIRTDTGKLFEKGKEKLQGAEEKVEEVTKSASNVIEEKKSEWMPF